MPLVVNESQLSPSWMLSVPSSSMVMSSVFSRVHTMAFLSPLAAMMTSLLSAVQACVYCRQLYVFFTKGWAWITFIWLFTNCSLTKRSAETGT